MELSSSDDIYSLKVDDFDTAQLLTNATRQRVYRVFSRLDQDLTDGKITLITRRFLCY